MKVVLVNGSPNEKGCTYTALKEMADEFGRQGVETEIVHIGKAAIHGCIGCGYCRKAGRCVFEDVYKRQGLHPYRAAARDGTSPR